MSSPPPPRSRLLLMTLLRIAVTAATILGCALAQPRTAPSTGYRGWSVYGGGAANIRYSKLDQIHRGNVAKLRVAWTYDTGDAFQGSEMQCNPIVVDGVLYATTPRGRGRLPSTCMLVLIFPAGIVASPQLKWRAP